MALIPVYGRFVGDFAVHLVAVDTEDTINEVASKIAVHAVGRRLAEQPGNKGLEVLAGGRTLAPTSRLNCHRDPCNGWTCVGNCKIYASATH